MAKDIPSTMKALRFYNKRDIRLETVDALPCGPDEVRVKVAYCGICGSDLHEYAAGPLFMPQHGQKHPFNGSSLPLTMGHEFSGVVVEVGETVAADNSIKIGQKVFIDPCFRDNQLGLPPCKPCSENASNICARLGFYGLSGPPGGLAEYSVVKSMNIFPLPDSIPLRIGALVEPLSVAWHAVRVSGIRRGLAQNAVILGAGPIGLALLLVLKAWGVQTVIVSEILEARRELARGFGADYVFNPQDKDGNASADPVVAKAREISGQLGGGADVAFEATGLQVTFDTAVACVKNGGTILNISVHEKPLNFNINALALAEKRLTGALGYTQEDISEVIAALADGSLVADKMVTATLPLEDAVAGGFEQLIAGKHSHVKVLIQPNHTES